MSEPKGTEEDGMSPMAAVITDMDGVLTQTASVHFDAWKTMFDEFLARHNRKTQDDQPSFSMGDYRRHVDGRPRYDGARTFLRSRGIDLPWGDPSDPPSDPTVCGLGNRKNEEFRQLLREKGVKTYTDAVAACRRWKTGGLALAIITASRNGRYVLDAAGLVSLADTIVDGAMAAELRLRGKEDLIREAARRLEVPVKRGVLIEDSRAGVEAGRSVGCGLVVGVDRDGHADGLEEAGADTVVESVAALRFPREVPSLLARIDDLERRRDGRGLALFVDFDGTLSPIVDNPEKARISPETREALRVISKRHTVAVVSGRDRAFIEEHTGISGIWYAGSHGLDIAGPGEEMVHPDARGASGSLAELEEKLRDELSPVRGVFLERKRFSLAVHYRNVEPDLHDHVREAVIGAAGASEDLRVHSGKMVLELQPDIDWNKGSAVRWMMDALDIDPDETLVLYLGDDETDEDAFEALAGAGIGIYVGPAVSTTLATYHLESPAEVLQFLRALS